VLAKELLELGIWNFVCSYIRNVSLRAYEILFIGQQLQIFEIWGCAVLKSGKNLPFLPQYSILYNYSHENLCVRSEVYMMVTVVNTVLRDMVLVIWIKMLLLSSEYTGMYTKTSLVLISIHQTMWHHIPEDSILSTSWKILQRFTHCLWDFFRYFSHA
jgi:hypothetical protein